MDTNAWYALLAPTFALAIGLELLAARRAGRRIHVLGDTLANLACGLGQVLLGVFTGAFFLALYDGFAERFALVRWEPGAITPWVLAFVLTDLCYYAFHRASHRVALLWAIHSVHHQSEEMNLSVALRQTWFSDFTALPFFWPLPLLGIPRDAFFVAVATLSLYEALQHTEVLSGARLWGLVLNTPATHRLHHARDARYRDRNYASTLVIWDRLFGTFVEETHPPTYGTTTPHRSWSPLWAQLAPLVELARRLQRAPHVVDRARILLMPPEWRAPHEARTDLPLAPRWEPPAPPRGIALYALAHSTVATLAGLLVIATTERLGMLPSGLLALVVVWSTASSAALIERRAWARGAELARLIAIAVLAAALAPLAVTLAVALLTLTSALALMTVAPARPLARVP